MTRVALAWLLTACAACAAPGVTSGPLAPPPLMRDVAALVDPALAGRAAGQDGEHVAARYVEDRLRRIGLAPRVQAVPYGGGSTNVYAVIAGARDAATADEMIVLGAHVDHLGVRRGQLYPGADDNASGVALVLGVAETLAARAQPLPRTVVIVLFGAEEHGLVGSKFFVDHPPGEIALARVRAMVNIDMIARPLLDQWQFRAPMWLVGIDRDRAVGVLGARHYPALRALADRAVAAAGAGAIVAAEDLPAAIDREVEAQSEGRSDSASFEAAGIPSLFFGDGESSDYHRPTDTIDKLDPELLSRRAAAVARVVEDLAAAPAETFAASEVAPPRRTPPSGWYLPIGGVAGIAHDNGRTGALLGGEASIAYFDRPTLRFAGMYADVVHDGAVHGTRVSGGPELGTHGIGVDGGIVLDGDGHRGGVVRVFATASVIALTVRVGRLAGASFGELGIAIKLPVALHAPRR